MKTETKLKRSDGTRVLIITELEIMEFGLRRGVNWLHKVLIGQEGCPLKNCFNGNGEEYLNLDTQEQRDRYIAKKQLKHVTKGELLKCRREIWESIEPEKLEKKYEQKTFRKTNPR